ncbi:hypothetical protein MAUB1S_11688 [Mycolicibacterium aubagnense]
MHVSVNDLRTDSGLRQSPDIRGIGNIGLRVPVAVDTSCTYDEESTELEIATTATTVSGLAPTMLAPTHMSHVPVAEAELDWTEVSDELTGTAVFDATGDVATMPSWDELVRQHADRVYRLAYRLSGNPQDAEDLTQETFIRVFRSVRNYQPGTFEGWLHRITTNLFLDMVRRRTRIRMEALPEDYDRVPADDPNPEQVYHDSRLGPDSAGCARFAAPGVPGRRGAVRHRRPLVRGDRRDARRQAGHRAQSDSPRPAGAAGVPGQPPR